MTAIKETCLYRFWGKYGEWIEPFSNYLDAQLRAYALNVDFEKVEED